MNQLERVARALATAFNNDDEDEWERFVDEAQAAIDAMAEYIAAADRAARLECAEICDNTDPYTYSSYIAADKIRETIK
jgi:hypothetical protein